jgi:hypothetical protein
MFGHSPTFISARPRLIDRWKFAQVPHVDTRLTGIRQGLSSTSARESRGALVPSMSDGFPPPQASWWSPPFCDAEPRGHSRGLHKYLMEVIEERDWATSGVEVCG